MSGRSNVSLRTCLCAASLFLWGCGYIGEPLPPLLNIPGRAENLTAVERGSNIIVHLTLPVYTTEGVVLKQNVHLDLRIGPKPSGAFNAAAWAAGARPEGGETIAHGAAAYQIPATPWIGHEVAIAVKVIGANGRDAGWSAPAALAVVAPPEQPRDLKAEAVPQGVRLTWHGSGNAFVVLRHGEKEHEYAKLGQSDKPEYLDNTAEFGKPYSYAVQAVVKAGEGEAQSELSNDANITPLDTFPPAAPVGLAAVPSTASIELVWERNSEPGVIGYKVYRALGNGPFALLADGVTLPAFSDRKIEPGKTYRYAVSAVKNNQAESKLSAPAEVAAP